jgi:Xaa-Pro dipeptidase
MAAKFQRRIDKAQQMMAEQGLDFLFVNNRENLIYFTGLTQIECLAVIIPREGEAYAVTLWLDADYVREQSGLATHGYFFPRESLAAKCIEKMLAYGYKAPRIGFERYFVAFGLFDALRRAFPQENFVNAADLFYRLRAIKDAGEINLMRRAGRIVAAGMAAAVKAVRPGVREYEVLAEAEYAMLKAGSDGSPFRPQVVSGERTLLTHPCASDKAIAEGEITVIHLGATVQGYAAKMCRTVAVGDIPTGQTAVFDLLLAAQTAAIAALRPGAMAADVDGAARRIVTDAGWEKYYLEQVGYGVGLRQSEFYPIIGRGQTEIIEEGMVVDLLLPTVYRPDIGGPRVTDCIYVGESANEILTDYPRKLIRAGKQ